MQELSAALESLLMILNWEFILEFLATLGEQEAMERDLDRLENWAMINR